MDSGSGLGAARLGDDVGDGVLERNIREEGTVELNIRSPVSSVEDLRIICPLDYRVDRLKEMISQQFPGNPKPQNQKLVYAGKLLEDGFRLNQFLRFEDECPVFTIHLVCRILQSESREPELRRRRVEKTSEELETEPLPALYQDGVNSWVQYLSSQNQYTEDHQQLVVMQELYTQYLSQYMQYMQTTTPVIQPEIQGGPNERERRDIGAAPAVMNAGGGAQGFQEVEEEGGNRDMLDWLYVSIRILILVSIVYFYSSLARFIIVAIIFLVLFSLQGGIWNWARGDRHHIQNEVNNIRGEDGEVRREDPVHREPRGEDEELRVENELEIRPPEPNLLLIVGDFVVSFFSSMIPDTNQPIA